MVNNVCAQWRIVRFYCCLIGMSFLLLGLQTVQAADVKVTVEHEIVSVNDSFTILFQAAEGVHGRPDLSALHKDFRIISTQQRSNVTIINGSPTSTSEWLLEVMAKHTGELTIPSIPFGRTMTPEFTVTVTEAAAVTNASEEDDIFLEVDVSQENSWVQAQVIYTIRLFRAVTTVNSRLSEPVSNYGQMFMEKLEDRQYETLRNNKRYAVLERRYALFPQSSGELTIEPISFQGQVTQGSTSLFDAFGRSSKAMQRFSRAIKLNVKPVPSNFSGKTWLPATRVELHEKWLKDDLTLIAGEPATRTIVLRAEGLMSAQLPEIGSPDMPGFRQYPDQPELTNQHAQSGILGVREEKSAVIANKAGDYVLPEVSIPWFNTESGKTEIARLPERIIKVIADPNSQPVAQDPVSGDSANEETTVATAPIVAKTSARYWPWIATFLGLGWLLTLLVLWRQKPNQSTSSDDHVRVLTERQSLRALREVIARGNPQHIKQGLLDWGKSVWVDSAPTSLAEIGRRSGGELAAQINALNAALYRGTETDWDKEKLLLAVEDFESEKQSDKTTKEDGLEPLYKL